MTGAGLRKRQRCVASMGIRLVAGYGLGLPVEEGRGAEPGFKQVPCTRPG